MNRLLLVGLIVFSSMTSSYADDAFQVYAPDQRGSRLLSVAVTAEDSGVKAKLAEPLALPFAATSIAQSPSGKRLFVSSGSGRGEAFAASVDIRPGGELRLIHTSKLSQPTGYTSVDRSGRFLLFSNYRSGNIGSYRIGRDGRVGELASSLQTPRPEAHCILTTRDNRFVYVPCVKNNNALYQYGFDQQTGKLTPLKPFNAAPPAMFGPRHAAYHPSKSIVYFSNEQQLGVSVYAIGAEGALQPLQHAVTMPRRSPFEQGKRDLHASDLAVTPNGKRLFVAVRDFNGDEDSVFTFRIEDDGKLSLIARSKVGDIPWKLEMSPAGKHLLVSESGQGDLSIYAIESDGKLALSARLHWEAAIRDMVVVAAPAQ